MSLEGWAPDYRRDVDGLRGLAILFVILFHAFPNLIPGGFIGVDIFFVISGFLITKIIKSQIDNNSFSFLRFYSRRIRRLFPSLILLMMACFVAGWFLFDVGDFKLLGKHMASSSAFVSNFIFLGESGYFDQTALTKPLLHIWSLSVEEQFYFIWPALIFSLAKIGVRLKMVLFLTLAASFLICLYFSYTNSAFAYYFPFCRFWELAVGALLNYLPTTPLTGGERPIRLKIVSYISLPTLIISPFLIDGSSVFPGWLALMPVLSTAALIAVGRHSTAIRNLLSHRAIVWFGLISYPLYLIHWPILSFWKIVTLETPSPLVGLAILLASTVIASLIYLAVERPIRSRGAWKTTSCLCMCLVVLGILGMNMFKRDGYPFRPITVEKMQSNIANFNQTLPNAITCDGNICFQGQQDRGKKTVFFWGDSVTANITTALTTDRVDKLRIQPIMSVMGACPPIEGYIAKNDSRTNCERWQAKGFSIIEEYKPDIVFLISDWHGYLTGAGKYNRLDIQSLLPTLNRITTLGAKKIIVVGQFPKFEGSQADVGRRVFSQGKPPFTKWLLREEIFSADNTVQDFAEKNNIHFLSPLDFLCNDKGCRISASDETYIPMAYDTLHMTPRGADVLFHTAFTADIFSD